MSFGGDSPSALVASWMLIAVTSVFVVARSYTRLVLIDLYAVDDHVYNTAFVLLLAYCITITIAASYGFGMNMADIENPKHVSRAILLEAIAQTFEIIGMALAKCSMGFFLLRLVVNRWHILTIWVGMATVMGSSISTCFVFWLSCTPNAFLWDKSIPGGSCQVNTVPVSYTLSTNCVIVDVLFAALPWLFIWNLQMPKREKAVVLASLSAGLIAGACGIKRTMEIDSLSSANYLRDTVGLIVWSCAELSVTMICIGVAVCRPLYKPYLDKLTSRNRGTGNGSHSNSGTTRYALRTFGGSTIVAVSARGQRDNDSDASILGPEYRDESRASRQGIKVVEEFGVTKTADESGSPSSQTSEGRRC